MARVALSTGCAQPGLSSTALGERNFNSQLTEWSFKSVGLGCIDFRCVSTNFRFANLAGIWPKSGRILSDLMRFGQYSSWSIEISLDLSRFGRNLLISVEWVRAYRIFGQNSRFLTGREQVFGQVVFIDFSVSQIATRIDCIRSWHWQLEVDRTTAWIRQLLGGEHQVQAGLRV